MCKIKKATAKDAQMAFMLDLSKACDSLECDFLNLCFQAFGFDP